MNENLFSSGDIIQAYENHYLRKELILNRILSREKTLNDLSVFDLSIDHQTGITDQNHIGGLPFTLDLAKKSKISTGTEVLDLGSGLGGPARYLAHTFGCSVVGIDISPVRYKDAVELTRLTGLSNLVRFIHGDIQSTEIPDSKFDIIWGQNSWNHIFNKSLFIQKWCNSLKPGGRFAFEDVYLKSAPVLSEDSAQLEQLKKIWLSHFISLEEWGKIISSNSLQTELMEDLSNEMINWLTDLIHFSEYQPQHPASPFEKTGWLIAKELAEKNIIGYFRMVAQE